MRLKINFKRILTIILVSLILINIISINAEEQSKEKIIKFGDKEIIIDENDEVHKGVSETRLVLTGSKPLKIRNKKGEIIEYNHFEKGAEFVLNSDGEIIRAEFTTTKKVSYLLGGYNVPIPEAANVVFENGEIFIGVPDGSKIEYPEKISEGNDLKFTYKTFEGKPIELPNGEEFYGTLYIDKGGTYFSDEEVKLDSLKIDNSKSAKTYFDFNGELNPKVEGPYISMNIEEGKLIVATNNEIDSPEVKFEKGNILGMLVEEEKNDYASIKALGNKKGSYIIIEDRKDEGLVPKAKTLGSFEMIQDNHFISYIEETDKYLFDPLKNEDLKETSTIAIEMNSYKLDKDGNDKAILENDQGLLVGNDLVFSFGKDFSYKVDENYPYKTDQRFYQGISNKWLYNYLSIESFERLTGVRLSADSYSKERISQENLRMLADLVYSLPEYSLEKVKAMRDGMSINEIAEGGGFRADSLGGPYFIILSAHVLEKNDFNTIRHEMIHTATLIRDDGFWDDWKEVSGKYIAGDNRFKFERGETPKYGFASAYGSIGSMSEEYNPANENYHPDEDVAEYENMLYRKDVADFLGEDNEWHKIYRGKMALLYRDGVISKQNFNSAFKLAKLPTDKKSVDRYIEDAKEFGRQK